MEGICYVPAELGSYGIVHRIVAFAGCICRKRGCAGVGSAYNYVFGSGRPDNAYDLFLVGLYAVFCAVLCPPGVVGLVADLEEHMRIVPVFFGKPSEEVRSLIRINIRILVENAPVDDHVDPLFCRVVYSGIQESVKLGFLFIACPYPRVGNISDAGQGGRSGLDRDTQAVNTNLCQTLQRRHRDKRGEILISAVERDDTAKDNKIARIIVKPSVSSEKPGCIVKRRPVSLYGEYRCSPALKSRVTIFRLFRSERIASRRIKAGYLCRPVCAAARESPARESFAVPHRAG